MLPFSFQKGNKSAGCEDAPPVANDRYSVVCDGLGGAGSTKHKVEEAGLSAMRTSGYLGSRVVANSVTAFYENNYDLFKAAVFDADGAINNKLQLVIENLKNSIKTALSDQMLALGIDSMLTRKKALKIFPTTLASALYFQDGEKRKILAIWAGDSRVYVLSPVNGLQMLSLDDAVNADIEMKSASEMNNCISAGNPFRLNFSIFEMDEPGIVFCCSDGCFDYLPSPLHFEWLLLQTILSCVPNAEADGLGEVFANSVRDTVYQSIGDDTTMAGIIYQIDTTEGLRQAFSPRMDQFGQLAVQMNDALKATKNCQSEKDAATKKCRLFEAKVIADVKASIINALMNKSPALLYSFVGTLPCYVDYQEMVMQIDKQIDEECVAELEELNKKISESRTVCVEMILRDYLKWRRTSQDPVGSGSSVMEFLSPRTRGITKKNANYLKPSSYVQPLNACLQLFSQPDFQRLGMSVVLPASDIEEYIQSQMRSIEALITIMENDSPLFEDMWAQAYFSTNRFEKERQEIKCSRDFTRIVEDALVDPMSCIYVSELTCQKIDSYKKLSNNMHAIQQKYMAERERRKNGVPEQFYMQHEKELIDSIFRQNTATLNSIFSGTGVSMDRLISFIESRNIMADIDQRVEETQKNVTHIWDLYRTGYQLFSRITEKGVV